MAKASVIIRFTNRSPERANNLFTLIRHISRNQNLEIIVSAMEKNVQYPEDIKQLRFGQVGRAPLIHTYTSKPFASTTANNIGAAKANSNIFIFQDADILFAPKAYNMIINQIKKGFQSIRVGEKCWNLNGVHTHKLKEQYATNWTTSPIISHLKRLENAKGGRDAPGACTAISRKAFADIGGWCELFQVYGWEDCYFRFKVRKLKHMSLNLPMAHLNHEPNYQGGHQPDNRKLYYEILYAKPDKYKDIIRRDRMALLNKYRQFK
jgi:predicted glycosyltransferase involved in capsule biosynthesis